MKLHCTRQRFPGYGGEWRVWRVIGDESRCLVYYMSDAPGNRNVLIVDGETGKVLGVTTVKEIITKKGGWKHE